MGQRPSKPPQKRKGRWLQHARYSGQAQKRRERKSRSCHQQKVLEGAGSRRDTAQRKAARRTDLRKQPALAKTTTKPRGPGQQQTGPKPKTALKGVPEQSSTRRENSAFADPHGKVDFHKKQKHYRILKNHTL